MSRASRARTLGLALALCCSGIVDSLGERAPSVEIESAILRNRVVVMDRVVMKKALYVAFSVTLEPKGRLRARGYLSGNHVPLSEASVVLSSERSGNLVFDLPFDIPDGSYDISVDVSDEHGLSVGSGSRTIARSDLRSAIVDAPDAVQPPTEVSPAPAAAGEIRWTDGEEARGYVVFARSPLSLVYPGSRPARGELVDRLSTRMARNASATLTFALQPLHPLGNVVISVSDLRNGGRTLPRKRVRLACVESVPDYTGMPAGKFRRMPVLLRPLTPKGVRMEDCRQIWIKVRVDGDASPGVYSGKVTIAPEHGAITTLPVELSVAPISLEDVPGVDYCMLMTYEFTELAMPWRGEQRKQLYDAAGRILADYREHGMTTLCLHSPFVLRTRDDGAPDLEDMQAALRAAHAAGFARPIVWYMGHLIQTAKPRHPGNIRDFSEDIQVPRLRYLVTAVSKFARDNGFPEVVFLPIDEPDDSYQDIGGRRAAITPLLVETIRRAGGRSMVTAEGYARSGKPDFLASSRMDAEELKAVHAGGGRYWRYENRVATECTSPAYARYQYGYYVWKNGIDGMSTWTFQNTQNAPGPPGKLPSTGREVYLAYPASAGPLSTPRWEAIAAGIEDYKLVYQLVKRVAKLRASGIDAMPYEDFLARMRGEVSEPACDADATREGELTAFDRRRDALVSMILRADRERRP